MPLTDTGAARNFGVFVCGTEYTGAPTMSTFAGSTPNTNGYSPTDADRGV